MNFSIKKAKCALIRSGKTQVQLSKRTVSLPSVYFQSHERGKYHQQYSAANHFRARCVCGKPAGRWKGVLTHGRNHPLPQHGQHGKSC